MARPTPQPAAPAEPAEPAEPAGLPTAKRTEAPPVPGELLAAAPLGALVATPEAGLIRRANPAAAALLGYDAGALTGLGLDRLVAARDGDALRARFAAPAPGAPLAVALNTRDGGELRARLHAYTAHLDGAAHWVVLFEPAPREQRDGAAGLAASVFASTREAVLVCDEDLCIRQVNDAFVQLTGFTAEAACGNTPQSLLQPEFGPVVVFRDPWRSLEGSGNWQGEMIARARDGSRFPVWVRVSAVPPRGDLPGHVVTLLTDLREKKAAEERIYQLANYDMLTGLPNRLLFTEHLERTIERARRGLGRFALLYLDLDRFKDVNDALGHSAGNRLLHRVAERLRGSVRQQDFLARMGGDEFALVLEPLAGAQAAAKVTQKVLDALHRPFDLGESEVTLGASAGISIYPEDGRDGETLLKNADTAMFQAKADGRDRYHFYTAELTRSTVARFRLERELRRALDNGDLIAHYQPQATAQEARLTGVEALARWQHPEQGWVPPVRFIQVAEEAGLVEQLGRVILHRACSDARAWTELGLPPLSVAVNLSGKQIADRELVAIVRGTLDETGLAAQRLELEITENYLIRRPDEGAATLRTLKDLGVSLAMDDFGTGYSSLAYLKRFPVDRLKVDQSFVHDLPLDRDSAAITRSISAIARSLGLELVAEGVETCEQLTFLNRLRCDQIQGYLLSRPLPAAELTAFVRRLQRLIPPGTGGSEAWTVIRSLGG